MTESGVLFRSAFLLALGLVTLGGYAILARLYFFRIPFLGACVSIVCYVISVAAVIRTPS